MFVTVTANIALDVTYDLARLRPGRVNRVETVTARAGGKGVNVARTLAALGEDVVAVGLAGGRTGAAIRAELDAARIPYELVAIRGDSRATLSVVEAETEMTTGLYEPGPTIEAGEWRLLVETVRGLLRNADAVVLAGSLPPGAPASGYAELGRLAAAYDVPWLVDTSGEPLAHAVAVGPSVVKPNDEELRQVTGGSDVLAGARELRLRGAQAVVVSRAEAGLVACTPAGCLCATVPEPVRGNPTGAGDAVVAALARGMVAGRPWNERLVDAAALSAAAVRAPVAGDFDADAYPRYRSAVTVATLE